jgi:DNA-binding transcriptional ArsR family regulator
MCKEEKNIEDALAEMAGLIGDPVRIKVLWTLLDGRAFTATELAISVDTSPQNLSMHLSKLIKADLLTVKVQGRHKYYAISHPEVAHAIEAMAGLPAIPRPSQPQTRKDPILFCRTCYDHLAGTVGVLVADSLIRQQLIRRKGLLFQVTAKGENWWPSLGIDLDVLRKKPRQFARVCLDWTERRPHLAGSLGAALLDKMRSEQWIRSIAHTRAVQVTPKGWKSLKEIFDIILPHPSPPG